MTEIIQKELEKVDRLIEKMERLHEMCDPQQLASDHHLRYVTLLLTKSNLLLALAMCPKLIPYNETNN